MKNIFDLSSKENKGLGIIFGVTGFLIFVLFSNSVIHLLDSEYSEYAKWFGLLLLAIGTFFSTQYYWAVDRKQLVFRLAAIILILAILALYKVFT